MSAEPARILEAPVADAQELLETFCYLACLGPDAFRKERIAEVVGLAAVPDRQALVENLANPDLRLSASLAVGRRLAAVLETRGRPATFDLGGMYPALVQIDVALGFRSLVALARFAGTELSCHLADPLLALALSEADSGGAGGTDASSRFRYLVEVLGSLDSDRDERTRLFLALAQTLKDPERRQDILVSNLFPGTPEAVGAVLRDGNNDALLAVLEGAATRSSGRTEFLDGCRTLLDADLAVALPIMGRLDHLLRLPVSNGHEPGYRPLVSALRAAVLVAIERDPGGSPGLVKRLAAVDDVPTLRLLSIVTPGIAEPMRSSICESLLCAGSGILRSGNVADGNSLALVEVLVSATVLHRDPVKAGATVRKALVETAGLLRVQLQARVPPDPACTDAARIFEGIALGVAAEFRRRNALTTCLIGALPLISDLSMVHDVPDSLPE